MRSVQLAGALALVGLTFDLWAAQTSDDMQACLSREMAVASPTTTVGELRARCSAQLSAQAPAAGQQAIAAAAQKSPPAPVSSDKPAQTFEPSALERRLGSELAVEKNPFGITPHRPNYILLAAHNSHGNTEPFEQEFGQEFDLDDVESKFQISLKFPLAKGLFGERADLMAGYTLRAFWQVYNTEESAPFRDYNHEPELWMSFLNGAEVFGWRNSVNRVGFNHQSNGRGGDFLSRSWNRVFATLIFDREDHVVQLKPWVIVGDTEDNPDIDRYLGHGEIDWAWAINAGNTLSLKLRNHLESGFSRGATQASWSVAIPNYDHLRAYFQVFSGYGENLMDYNKYNTSIGVGVSLNDWLQ